MFQATTDSKLDPKNKVEVLIIPLFEYKQLFESDKQFMLFTFIDWISMETTEKEKSTKISVVSVCHVLFRQDQYNVHGIVITHVCAQTNRISSQLQPNSTGRKTFLQSSKIRYTHRIIYRGFVCVDFYGEHGETVNDLAMDEMKLPLKIFVMKIIFQNHVFCGPNEGESQQNKYQTFIYLFPSWLSPITSITKLNLLLELYNNCVFNMKYNQRNGNGHVFIRFLRPKKRNRHKCFNFVLNGNKSTKPLYKTST